jgi:helicase
MNTSELIRYGISSSIIDVWEKSGLKSLLPVQTMAVRKFDLFGPGNLIVSAPTSSGKTFVGEMAAVKNALENKKVFYCVPLKALAEEKYHEFKRKYEKYGIRVAVSTRDRREYDEKINAGELSIADTAHRTSRRDRHSRRR